MREAHRKQEVLEQALAALKVATGLDAQIHLERYESDGQKALLDVLINGQAVRFFAAIKAIDRFQTLGAIRAKVENTPYPLLLVAPYITEAVAEKCRELHLPFIDGAGNAYLEAPGIFVYVRGKGRPIQAPTAPAFRALTPAGLKIVFALLNDPALAAAPYRAIATVAKVALGTLGDVLADLEQRGHLFPEKPGPRRLLALERLRDEWVTHYPIKLRPKLNVRRFTAPDRDWWRNLDIAQYQAYWGGEVAAEKLTGYLKPERITVYLDGKADKLILANRLRPDVNGEIELLDAFWATEKEQPEDTVPPLLVYADLMAIDDPRASETANLILDQYLTQAPHTA